MNGVAAVLMDGAIGELVHAVIIDPPLVPVKVGPIMDVFQLLSGTPYPPPLLAIAVTVNVVVLAVPSEEP